MSTLRISLEPHAPADLRVAEPFRGHGHGRQLLAAAKRYAIERGCTRAWLTTFGFQAPEFYPKLGDETFAVHRHHFFQKRLPAS